MKMLFLILFSTMLTTYTFGAESILSDIVEIGQKDSSANKEFRFHKGDGTKAVIRYSPSENKLKQSVDNGTTFDDLGTSSTGTAIPMIGLIADWDLGNVFYEDTSTSGTMSFSNIKDGETINLAITNSGTGDIDIVPPQSITTGLKYTVNGGKSLFLEATYFENNLFIIPENNLVDTE